MEPAVAIIQSPLVTPGAEEPEVAVAVEVEEAMAASQEKVVEHLSLLSRSNSAELSILVF